ncbi:hypothetical protein [Paenibacillus medicaginis]|uniref:Uncharacterized protein n=1 Tax=Paenibacillus medicaginis TaxID=1470560 RepID=A0ABV5BXU2_9BACL
MSELMEFHCVLSINEANTPKIQEILINIFGNPSPGNERLQNYEVFSLEENEQFKGFKLKCTENELKTVKEQLSKLGINNLDSYFSHIRKHFHPNCTLNKVEHEGVAYKNKLDWEVKYTEGPLTEKLGNPDEDGEYFIFSLKKSERVDGNELEYINKKFKEWVENSIKHK